MGTMVVSHDVMSLIVTFATALILGLVWPFSLWLLGRRRWFQSLTAAQRADFVSRVPSTIHASCASTAAFVFVTRCGLWGDEKGTCDALDFVFAASAGEPHWIIRRVGNATPWRLPRSLAGYFIQDMVWVIYHQFEGSVGFLLHHAAALLVLLSHNFYPQCNQFSFMVSQALMLEPCVVWTNVVFLATLRYPDKFSKGSRTRYIGSLSTTAAFAINRIPMASYSIWFIVVRLLPAAGWNVCTIIIGTPDW